MLKDRIVRVLLFIALIGSLITSLDLYMFSNLALSEAFRQGTFMAVSGLCTCGLQNSNPHAWAVIPLAVVALMMFIGGAMGSAAGGVKVNRVIMVYEGMKWWFRRFFVSSRVTVPLRFGGKTVSKELSELAISKNLLVIVVYVLTIFIATILTLHLYITSFRLEEVVFELVSALSNVGLSVGFISSGKPGNHQMALYPPHVAGQARDRAGRHHCHGCDQGYPERSGEYCTARTPVNQITDTTPGVFPS